MIISGIIILCFAAVYQIYTIKSYKQSIVKDTNIDFYDKNNERDNFESVETFNYVIELKSREGVNIKHIALSEENYDIFAEYRGSFQGIKGFISYIKNKEGILVKNIKIEKKRDLGYTVYLNIIIHNNGALSKSKENK